MDSTNGAGAHRAAVGRGIVHGVLPHGCDRHLGGVAWRGGGGQELRGAPAPGGPHPPQRYLPHRPGVFGAGWSHHLDHRPRTQAGDSIGLEDCFERSCRWGMWRQLQVLLQPRRHGSGVGCDSSSTDASPQFPSPRHAVQPAVHSDADLLRDGPEGHWGVLRPQHRGWDHPAASECGKPHGVLPVEPCIFCPAPRHGAVLYGSGD
mmetsp:Transcript_49589/g.108299  ORF Transcript_49589/g.108299 Transcript_49589/m.108299 type:complete len:205 (-) Transcript_49589:2895-3509(-)